MNAAEAIHQLAEMPNGDLVLGGSFWIAGGAAVNRIVRWDGASWHGFGSGVQNGQVRAIAV